MKNTKRLNIPVNERFHKLLKSRSAKAGESMAQYVINAVTRSMYEEQTKPAGCYTTAPEVLCLGGHCNDRYTDLHYHPVVDNKVMDTVAQQPKGKV